jgi:CheY-like chemotaxis protein
MNNQKGILVAEDDPDDLFFLERAISRAGLLSQTTFVNGGIAVIRYLSGAGPYANRDRYPLPKLVLLDLAMPQVSGLEVLRWVGQQPLLKTIPIVVFTGTEAPGQLQRALDLGAKRCVLKTNEVSSWVGLIGSVAHDFGLCPTIPFSDWEPSGLRKAA